MCAIPCILFRGAYQAAIRTSNVGTARKVRTGARKVVATSRAPRLIIVCQQWLWKGFSRNVTVMFTECLQSHEGNSLRRAASSARLIAARSAGETYSIFSDPGLTVFAAGSMGRAELGTRSDLDLFILAIKSFDDSEKEKLVAGLDEFIADLKYPALTNRDYVKVYELGNILRNTGSPKDDTENCFTTRMLLLLESVPIVNSPTYSQVLDQVLSQYFRDERGKSSYRPLFLLNDILRYWRTLCLNYEALRHDAEKPWWKKNINLKFSRMLTVFATVAALTVEEIHSKDDFVSVCDMTPIQRLARALDRLGDDAL